MIIVGLRLWIQTNEAVSTDPSWQQHPKITYVQVICDYCHLCIKSGHDTTGLMLKDIIEAARNHEHRAASPAANEAARIEEQRYIGFSKHRKGP